MFNTNSKQMAIRKGNFMVGTVGKTNFRNRKGKQVIQSNPGKGNVRQTSGTKSAAGIFGKSSSLAADFRWSLSSIIGKNYDGDMVSRLTGVVRPIIEHAYDRENSTFKFSKNDFQRLAGFDFNNKSPIQNNLWIMPETSLEDNLLTITIPKLESNSNLIFPAHTNLCHIIFHVSIYRLEEGLRSPRPEVEKIEVRIDQGTTANQQFVFPVPEGCLCIAGIGLDYYSADGEMAVAAKNLTFNPAAICCVYVNKGKFTAADTHKWTFNEKAVFK